MVAEPPATGDALTGPRVTVMGRFVKVDEDRVRRRYLARHPEASFYAGFGDFAFWRLEPERAHAVAGFGRIETLGKDEVFPSAGELAAIEEGAVQHMNEDHADAIALLAEKSLGAAPAGWRMAAIDPDGADLVKDGESSLRLAFPEPVTTAAALRSLLARLTRDIRNR